MIKIIEYVQESTRDNWPFNTGIEIFWLEMHIKKYDVATCTSY